MGSRRRLGLRGQLMLALSAAFLISFALLMNATVRLTERARELDRQRTAEVVTRAYAAALPRPVTGSALAELEEALERALGRSTGEVVGLAAEGGRDGSLRRGRRGSIEVRTPLDEGAVLKVWLDPPGDGAPAPLTRLLFLYALVTGAAILLLTYVVLTHLIVRPVEALTRASERFARGASFGRVPTVGAAEVVRLAEALSDMASQLRGERASLEARLHELEETTRALAAAQKDLVRSEKLASVGRLAAGIAHEIGNPLAAILGLVELLRDGGLEPSEQAEFLRRIHGETQRIHRTIRELLDFSRQDEGDAEAAGSSRLDEVVEDAVRLVAPQKDLRTVNIERRLEEELPPVRGEAHRLTQVVLNLLLNAADAIGGEGTILIDVHRDEEDEGIVSLVMRDSGPGIAPEVITTIFEPFVTTKPVGQGTGLGLAVCATIIQGLGGTITASNAPEGGARFEIRLPIANEKA